MVHLTKRHSGLALALGFSALTSSYPVASQSVAECAYRISNEWGAGFTAEVTITNTGSVAIDGWELSWQYNANTVTNAWNAQVSGDSGLYTATPSGWNSNIGPGQTVAFGLQGTTNGGDPEIPPLSGDVCSGSASSSSSSSSQSTDSSASTVSSSSSSAIAPSGDNLAITAQVSTSYVSSWETLDAVNDGSTPTHSNDKSSGAYGNWNNPDSYQWVEYQWPQAVELDTSEIYWFDDGGGVLTPTDAYLEYWDGASWIQAGDLPLNADTFNALELGDIVTNRIRVKMTNNTQSTGILEWRVWGTAPSGSSSSSSSSGAGGGAVPYQAITDEYTRFGVNTSNARYMDSDRFRAYYGGDGLNGGQGNLANVPPSQIANGLNHLEAAYECFVNEWGFRSTSLSVHSEDGPYYKMNLYSTTTLNAGGAMGADAGQGLSFIEFRDNALNRPETAVHEFGHSLTYTDYTWVDQGATGAWWEAVANWVADTYNTDPLCEAVRVRNGLGRSRDTIVNLETNIASSHLPIVSTSNYYQAWPLLTYLTQNPDQYPGIGRMAVPDLFANHRRNNETPLHVLERMVSPISVQQVIGRYWARMAYLDIGHPKAQARYLGVANNEAFRSRAYTNLEALGSGVYRVRPDREPAYAGANITPLNVTGNGQVDVQVTNLGNGLSDSDFTATLSIRNTSSGSVRYVDLINGAGSTTVADNEEVSLVVANTPLSVYQYNAFESTESSPESIGLRYEVEIDGAVPERLP
ncbi:cellulose binding domain-containing protein [Marinimicrobium agarilyticum]|uniref:cellulose binding domain-containing protein n=1 Tax=Marinimicrobium agarilyticum TaxID=306546 RepID=UPI000408B71D|nr:cellulose binding domain-containing protein [Marinimicrobium agarilyticum]